MIRLFVGLGLDQNITNSLSLLAGGIPGARWVGPESFHITLLFIGEVPENRAVEVNDGLSEIIHPAFSISIDGLGTFGHAKPHTLWAGVTLTPELDHLHRKVVHAIDELDLDIDHRKFIPHITLARLSDAPGRHLETFITENSPFHGGTQMIRSVSLIQSILSSEGSTYLKLMDYPLG